MTRRNARTVVSLAALALIAAVGGGLLFAGPLNPPAGPVTSTYKTLTEVEPRTAINAANTPGNASYLFRITQPGSYYLTGNLTGVSGKSGIEIAAAANGPGVSIDLMGFELAGVPGSLAGIGASVVDARNISIRNGSVRGWGSSGIDLFGAQNNLLADLRTHANGGPGIWTGTASVVTHCTASSNLIAGFDVGDRSIVSGCMAFGNTGIGIRVSNGCTLTGCTASSNTGDGIRAFDRNTVTGCTSSTNAGDGIEVGSSGTVTVCTSSNNTGDGIDVGSGSTVAGCTASSNVLNGIRIGSDSRVTDNTCDGNGVGAGLFSGIFTQGDRNRIEGNHVTNNDFGIGVGGVGHLIIRNYAGNNTTNYSLPASNSFVGTIIGNSAAMNAATNSTVNISF